MENRMSMIGIPVTVNRVKRDFDHLRAYYDNRLHGQQTDLNPDKDTLLSHSELQIDASDSD